MSTGFCRKADMSSPTASASLSLRESPETRITGVRSPRSRRWRTISAPDINGMLTSVRISENDDAARETRAAAASATAVASSPSRVRILTNRRRSPGSSSTTKAVREGAAISSSRFTSLYRTCFAGRPRQESHQGSSRARAHEHLKQKCRAPRANTRRARGHVASKSTVSRRPNVSPRVNRVRQSRSLRSDSPRC